MQGCRQLADDATRSGTNALKFSSLIALLFFSGRKSWHKAHITATERRDVYS